MGAGYGGVAGLIVWICGGFHGNQGARGAAVGGGGCVRIADGITRKMSALLASYMAEEIRGW